MSKVMYYVVLAVSLYVLYGLGDYIFSSNPTKGQASFIVFLFFVLPAVILAIGHFIWSFDLYKNHYNVRFLISIAMGALLIGASVWAVFFIKK